MPAAKPPAGTPAQEPLLLLHGVTNSARIWDDVAALLSPHFDVIAPTAAGHRGGPPAHPHSTIAGLLDDLETVLDGLGLETVHVAGNSLGGFMAIELGRRGRARTVCALSPAGFWTPGSVDHAQPTRTIRRGLTLARRLSAPARIAMHIPIGRRLILRDAAKHADRLSAHRAQEFLTDMIECTAARDLLGTTESVEPLDPLPCPVTLAWSACDRIFPPQINGRTARERLPAAHYRELPAVGHIPMIDDPQLCALVIREAAQATN